MIRKGTKVKWKWGKGRAEGKVLKTYTTSTTRTIKGNDVTRDGTKDDKALYIETDDSHALKLESEVSRAD